MNKVLAIVLLFILSTGALSPLHSRSDYQNSRIEHWDQKAYYAYAYHYQRQKIPQFKRRIDPRYLHLFKRYYVVFFNHSQVIAFDVIENRVLFARNLVYHRWVLSLRFDHRKQRILYQKLYYDSNNRLIKEANYRNGKLSTYITYKYDSSGNQSSWHVFNRFGKELSKSYPKDGFYQKNVDNEGYYYEPDYGHSKRKDPITGVPSGMDYGGESRQAMISKWPDIRLKPIQIIRNNNIHTKRIRVVVYNASDESYDGLSISVDLFDRQGNMVDSLVGHIKDYDKTLEPSSTVIFESSETRKRFSRVRLYIHYSVSYDPRPSYIGPIFFSPKRK